MKIFVVDDDPLDRSFIRGALQRHDADLIVLECESGQDVLDKSNETAPVYALVDIRMPGLNGFETCKALRRGMPGRRCYIRMLTTSENTDDHAAALQSGADAVYVKPSTVADYANLASSILSDWKPYSDLKALN